MKRMENAQMWTALALFPLPLSVSSFWPELEYERNFYENYLNFCYFLAFIFIYVRLPWRCEAFFWFEFGFEFGLFYYRMFSICTCPFAAYPYSFSEPSSTTIQKMESMERRIVFLHAEVCNWRLLDRMDFLHVFPELRTQYSGCCWFFHRRFNRWTDAKQKQIIHIFVSKNFQYVPLHFRRCR